MLFFKKKWFLVQKTYYVSKNCLEVMNNENILEKDKKVMVARLPIKSIDEIELIKDLYRKKNQLQELSILSFSSSLKFKGEVCL